MKIRTVSSKVVLFTGLLAIAACSSKQKKIPEELPPPPPPVETVVQAREIFTPPVETAPVPGSYEDFLQKLGQENAYVLFAYDSSDLDGTAQAILNRQIQWLRSYPDIRCTIEGNTDERGTRDYNLALGARRAEAVKEFMISRGIDANRIGVISYGKERPAVEGSTEAAYRQNRRAVTVF